MKELIAEMLAGMIKAIMQQTIDSLLAFRLSSSVGQQCDELENRLHEQLKKDGWE